MAKRAKILLVEDSEDEALLLLRAFAQAGMEPPVVVRTGEEALEYLSENGPDSASGLPAMVLLDLTLPGMDGFEVLRRIRGQQATRRLVVVVLTSSRRLSDAGRAYQCGANSFLVKDLEFAEERELIKFIQGHLRRMSQLVPGSGLEGRKVA